MRTKLVGPLDVQSCGVIHGDNETVLAQMDPLPDALESELVTPPCQVLSCTSGKASFEIVSWSGGESKRQSYGGVLGNQEAKSTEKKCAKSQECFKV